MRWRLLFMLVGRATAERYCAAHPQVLVPMLESSAERPLLIGNHDNCEVEIMNEDWDEKCE